MYIILLGSIQSYKCQSYLNVVYERDSSHIYRSSDVLNDLFTMKVLLSALTQYVGGVGLFCWGFFFLYVNY